MLRCVLEQLTELEGLSKLLWRVLCGVVSCCIVLYRVALCCVCVCVVCCVVCCLLCCVVLRCVVLC